MIKIENLSKSFGSLNVLSNISVEIQKGDVISVIGPSGCGKSTFLRCINKLETPDTGHIYIDGADICSKKANIAEARKKMGMVFQSFNLFSHLMIIENIMFGPTKLLGIDKQTAYDEGMKLLDLVGLKSKAHAYPSELSGGQKQRVAIARTLAMKPEVVLFDEPTSALDPTMVSEVLGVIKRLAADGLTMIIVTHEMKFARNVSNRVFYMDEKGIYEDGTPEQIFENPQKEKTRIFINKIRSVSVKIENADFDLYGFIGKLEDFAMRQVIEADKVASVQHIAEELAINMLIPKFRNLTIIVNYSDLSETLEVEFEYSGEKYDPLADSSADELSMAIAKKQISGYEHSFDAQTKTNKLLLFVR